MPFFNRGLFFVLVFAFACLAAANLPLAPSYNLEKLDPKHRYVDGLKPVFDEWSKGKSGSEDQKMKQFIKELNAEGSDLPNKIAKQYRGGVKYFDATQRSQFVIEIDPNGRITQGGKKLPAGEHIFVMGEDGKTYVSQKVRGTMHHSSFFSGDPVLSAGTIEVGSDGKISKFSNHSGHYQPGPEEIKLGVKAFEKAIKPSTDFSFSKIVTDKSGQKRGQAFKMSRQELSLPDQPAKAESARLVGASENSITIEKTTDGKTQIRKIVPVSGDQVDVYKVDQNGKRVGGARRVQLQQYLDENSIALPESLKRKIGDAKKFRQALNETDPVESNRTGTAKQTGQDDSPEKLRQAARKQSQVEAAEQIVSDGKSQKKIGGGLSTNAVAPDGKGGFKDAKYLDAKKTLRQNADPASISEAREALRAKHGGKQEMTDAAVKDKNAAKKSGNILGLTTGEYKKLMGKEHSAESVTRVGTQLKKAVEAGDLSAKQAAKLGAVKYSKFVKAEGKKEAAPEAVSKKAFKPLPTPAATTATVASKSRPPLPAKPATAGVITKSLPTPQAKPKVAIRSQFSSAVKPQGARPVARGPTIGTNRKRK